MPQERLPMRKIREVLRLKAGGFSKRRIAASLGISATAAMECIQRGPLTHPDVIAGNEWTPSMGISGRLHRYAHICEHSNAGPPSRVRVLGSITHLSGARTRLT